MTGRAPAAHGEARRYNKGCRCDQCRAAAVQGVRERRHRNRAARVNDVAVGDVVHGTTGYTNRHCRCDVCCGAHRESMRGFYARRLAAREDIDGVLVAVAVPEENHGRTSTYRNFGCRCGSCSAAESARKSRRAGVQA